MWWSNLLHLSARLIAFACLITLFGRCEKATIDEIPPVLTLVKGTKLSDPVVQTTPQSLSTIIVNNRNDILLARASTKLVRPTSVAEYAKAFQPFLDSATVKMLPNYEFKWVATEARNVMVCIFKNVVSVDSKTNEIVNKADLVWLSTPPRGSTDPGKVIYQDGQTAEWTSGKYTLTKAVPLPTGYYVWCVLAWDKQGINIIAASRELPINIVPK